MDDRHIREIYAVSYARLVTQMVALCGDRAEAEDLVQESFMTALSHAAAFEDVANKEAWLRTVALNRLRKQWRRQALVRRVLPRLAREETPPPADSSTTDHLDVVMALRWLTPVIREAVVLFYVADLSVAQIAQELEVPEGTVKARLARGRASMGRLLGEVDDGVGPPVRTSPGGEPAGDPAHDARHPDPTDRRGADHA